MGLSPEPAGSVDDGSGPLTPMRCFDPNVVGRDEARAWAAYYQRRWVAVLASALRLTRHAFGLNRRDTLRAGWWVLRANLAWKPYPDNDPDLARELMRRVYQLVAHVHGETIDPVEAARLEVEWWRVHRVLQRESDADAAIAPLVQALTALYAYVYGADPRAVTQAAGLRAKAMRASDRWVAAGASASDQPALREIEQTLVRSYASLLASVHRPRRR